MSELGEFLRDYLRHSPPEYCKKMVNEVEGLWAQFCQLGLDTGPDFVGKFTSGNRATLDQNYSELIVGCGLADWGFSVSSPASGPDFHINDGFGNLWIEVICPELGNGADAIPMVLGENHLDREILLRWTSAIDAKAKKYSDYIRNGLVSVQDRCVIAINAGIIAEPVLAFEGINGLPYAVNATCAVGPIAVRIDLKTNETTHQHLVFKPDVEKESGTKIETGVFLSGAMPQVSGIMAFADKPESVVGGFWRPPILVHNLKAAVTIADDVFGDFIPQYRVEEISDTEYQLSIATPNTPE